MNLRDSPGIMKVQAVVAALPTQYSAAFAGQQLESIDEARASGNGDAQQFQRGRYEFHGARLVRYSGTQLQKAQSVELKFDLQGALLSDTAGLSVEDIAAIKNRAQLLRSHALAQHAARGHTDH